MEVAFSPILQQETRILDERNEHGSDDKNEEFESVEVYQYCSLQELEGENHTDEEEEDDHRHNVSKVVSPFDGLSDGVEEDPSCR